MDALEGWDPPTGRGLERPGGRGGGPEGGGVELDPLDGAPLFVGETPFDRVGHFLLAKLL